MSTPVTPSTLKSDLFGTVGPVETDGLLRIRRDTAPATWWIGPVARHLAAREARALGCLDALDDVPRLCGWNGVWLDREWLPGAPMQQARPQRRSYYRDALRILRRMHRAGVVHNDTAKEPNWLVKADGSPALLDFQLAMRFRGRGRFFRMLAREDLRHLLKHKRTYLPGDLTARQKRILDTPAVSARAWRATVKPVYRFVTRRIMGWSDREGAGDRSRS
jgi:RIO-like serine/threonine protein kinase